MEQLVASSSVKLERIYFQKMCFIMNALENGWSVKKKDESFIFTKKLKRYAHYTSFQSQKMDR
jgi:hypothetical protein